ncbi:hypothetical protein [Dapis sp. BLCC M172]
MSDESQIIFSGICSPNSEAKCQNLTKTLELNQWSAQEAIAHSSI